MQTRLDFLKGANHGVTILLYESGLGAYMELQRQGKVDVIDGLAVKSNALTSSISAISLSVASMRSNTAEIVGSTCTSRRRIRR